MVPQLRAGVKHLYNTVTPDLEEPGGEGEEQIRIQPHSVHTRYHESIIQSVRQVGGRVYTGTGSPNCS